LEVPITFEIFLLRNRAVFEFAYFQKTGQPSSFNTHAQKKRFNIMNRPSKYLKKSGTGAEKVQALEI